MPIKNYTTRISAGQTIQEIQKNLVKHGARAIMIEYDKGDPSGLSFLVPTKHGDVPFRLPTNTLSVQKVLEEQRVKSDKKMASNVAWRIMKDWIEAQMAIIEAELVTLEQVFLPYMQMPGENQTLYDAMVARGFYLEEGKG